MSPFSTSSARWTAITTRDSAASNPFVYCVTSTKIFCRPTCPARLARRANVVFHNTAAEAERAGYRACMRCRPGESSESEGDPQRIAVAKACELVRKEIEDGQKWSVKALAKEVGLTESHFCRVFKKITGVTVGDYRATGAGGEKKKDVEEAVAPRKPAPIVWEDGGVGPSFEFPYLPVAVQAETSLIEFDPDLILDWQEFSGTQNVSNTLDIYPGISAPSLANFDLSPEMISDASTPTTTDDGFHFLDFNAV